MLLTRFSDLRRILERYPASYRPEPPRPPSPAGDVAICGADVWLAAVQPDPGAPGHTNSARSDQGPLAGGALRPSPSGEPLVFHGGRTSLARTGPTVRSNCELG